MRTRVVSWLVLGSARIVYTVVALWKVHCSMSCVFVRRFLKGAVGQQLTGRQYTRTFPSTPCFKQE